MTPRSDASARNPRPGRAPEPSALHLPRIHPAPDTVLEYLLLRFPHVGEEVWRGRIAEGSVIWSDGGRIGEATPYAPDATVLYFRESMEEEIIPFAEEIIHRDRHLLVADKPHFLPVVPSGPYVAECLLFRLRRRTGLPAITPAHRLDRETAGLVLFALDPTTRPLYHKLFAEGDIIKEYLAIGEGSARLDDTFTINCAIAPGEPWFRMRGSDEGADAITHVRVLAREGNRVLFHLRPESGRKHQLRVHLMEIGYPIVNDGLYPEVRPFAPYDYGRALQLLAYRLSFTDPVSGLPMEFTSGRRLEWE